MIDNILPEKLDELVISNERFTASRPQLSFCVSTMRLHQISLELITSINKYSSIHNDLDFLVYNTNIDIPIQTPLFGTFSRTELFTHKGPIITTDPYTCNIVCSCKFIRNFYYVYDPLLLFYFNKQIVQDIINSNTIFIARTKDHRNFLLKQFGIFCEPTLIPNINEESFKDFMEIINGRRN